MMLRHCVNDDENVAAAVANIAMYDQEGAKKYINGAPHIKHASLRNLYAKLAEQVYQHAQRYAVRLPPKVLDLGAGEGSTTMRFLELGAAVTAVDISKSQLSALQARCGHFKERLETRCCDIGEALEMDDTSYDVIVASSFLHHIPDYLGLIRRLINHLAPNGQFLFFQDPLLYDSMGRLAYLFSNFAYFSWRVFQGDLLNGVQTRIRRAKGIYLTDCEKDNAEYHVTRNGVDQDAIAALLQENGFCYKIIQYFSTQNSVFQPIGTFLGIKNTFAIIAERKTF